MEVESFKELVRAWWAKFPIKGHAGHRLTRNLKKGIKLKEWAKENYNVIKGVSYYHTRGEAA